MSSRLDPALTLPRRSRTGVRTSLAALTTGEQEESTMTNVTSRVWLIASPMVEVTPIYMIVGGKSREDDGREGKRKEL